MDMTCHSPKDVSRLKIGKVKPNGISHFINLVSPFSFKWVERLYFSFYQNSNRIFCKQTVETLISHPRAGSALFVYVPQKGRSA